MDTYTRTRETLKNIYTNARDALDRLDKIEEHNDGYDDQMMLNAYEECVSEFRLITSALAELVEE